MRGGSRYVAGDRGDGGGLAMYRLVQPLPGEWTVVLVGHATETAEITTYAGLASSIRMAAGLIGAVDAGATASLTATVLDGSTPIGTAAVEAFTGIERRTDVPTALTHRGNGVYVAPIRAPDSAGLVEVTIRARGVGTDGQRFEREVTRILEVRWPACYLPHTAR